MDMQHLWTYIIAIFLFTSSTAFADERKMAPVGIYNENGEIELIREYFRDTFPDGRAVEDLKVVKNEGFLYVSRKGYKENGACKTELIPLTEKLGQRVVEGSDPRAGKEVYITSLFAMVIKTCVDDGCSKLKNIGLPDNPMLRGARCDMTELSDNKCSCHIDRGIGDELIAEGFLCKGGLLMEDSDVDEWVDSGPIQTIPE